MSPVKKIIFSFAFIISLSCGSQPKEQAGPDLSHINKISLIYKTDFDSTAKLQLKSIDVTNSNDINSLIKMTSAKPTTYLYCVSTGAMNLYSDSAMIVSIVFNTSDDFRHIAFNFNNKLTALELSEENAKLLETFKNQIAKN